MPITMSDCHIVELLIVRVAECRRTVRSCSAVVMSISAGAVTTGTPLIIKGSLMPGTSAHLPRGMEILPTGPGWVYRRG